MSDLESNEFNIVNKTTFNHVKNFMTNHMRFNSDDDTNTLDGFNPFFQSNCTQSLNNVKNVLKKNEVLNENESHIKSNILEYLNSKLDNGNYRFPLTLNYYYTILESEYKEGVIVSDSNSSNSGSDGTKHKKHKTINNILTILSLKNIMENYDKYDNIVVVGISYYGMGLLNSLAMDKSNGDFFFITEGGPNGYDVEYNHKFNKKLIPSNHKVQKFRLPQLLKNIQYNGYHGFKKMLKMSMIMNE